MNWILPVLMMLQTTTPRPWLGVQMSVITEEIQVGEQVFQRGIRFDRIVPDSPAHQSGIQVGDILVGIKGIELECPADQLLNRFREIIGDHTVGDTLELIILHDGVKRSAMIGDQQTDEEAIWEDFDTFTAERQPNTRITLAFEHVRELRTTTIALAAAPVDASATTFMPANDVIFEIPIEHLTEEDLATRFIQEYKALEDYRELRQRLADLVKQGDPTRLSRFAYAMREPFAMPALSRQLAGTPDDLPALLHHAGEWLDLPLDECEQSQLKTGLTPAEHASQIERLLTEVNTLHQQAFAKISSDDLAFVEENIPVLGEAFIEDLMIMRISDMERLAQVQRLVELAPKVDRSKLLNAAIRLSALIDPDYLNGLRKDLAGQGAGQILKHDTTLGAIILSGPGASWYREPAAVIIDLGGDDFYTHPMHRPVNAIIDLGGNDLHQATFNFAQGFGLCGVALHYDESGNDRYVAQRWAQGSAAFGVGVLIDRDGNDYYRGSDYTQGVAFNGIGILIDERGTDRYDAPRYAQAMGMPGGFGALVDRAGNDHYYCGGRDQTCYATQGVFDAFGQGFGVGFRSLASGGIGLLVDECGDDIYEGGNFAQGGGYYYGWGALVDRAGDDQYLGSRYAQAFAAHQAIGYLEDHAGDDHYSLLRDVGQSCSWDQTVTALIDRAGNDVYSGGGFGLAASAHNGLALLIDYAGQDQYQRHQGYPRAGANTYHGGTSFSLLLDFGGDEDTYVNQDRNNTIGHGMEHGFFADLSTDAEEAEAELKALFKKSSD